MQKIREILRIGIPIMLGQACIIILAFADNIMIGWYGVNELAAASFVNGIINLFIFTELAFACGMTPVIGEKFGQGNSVEVGATLKNSIVLNTITGLAGLVLLGAIYVFLDKFGQEEQLLPLIRPYYAIVAVSTLFALGFNTLKQFTDGVQQPVVSMSVLMGGNMLNILGNWLLIYGKAGFPRLGLTGAGISTLVSRILMLAVFAVYVMRSRRFRQYSDGIRKSTVSAKSVRRLASLGVPLALQTAMESSTFSLSAIMVGWIGATALAAHQVTMTISQISFMMMMGLSTAVSVLVSNAYGRKDLNDIKGYASHGCLLTLSISAVLSISIWFTRYEVVSLFTDSDEVTAIALSLLMVLFGYQFGDGLQLCYSNVL
ncbi:MAG: MATE family efflux transporter, partial [Clostridium sp.]|nr:MATE family efflux transporter [Clostridium sp.]